jgi:hypothetical protein
LETSALAIECSHLQTDKLFIPSKFLSFFLQLFTKHCSFIWHLI